MNIEIEYKRGILFVRLDGILNKRTSSVLKECLNNVIKRAGIKFLLFNLEKLYDIDKTGIATIIDSYQQYLRGRGKLLICGCSDQIKINIENSDLLHYAYSTQNEVNAFNLVNL